MCISGTGKAEKVFRDTKRDKKRQKIERLGCDEDTVGSLKNETGPIWFHGREDHTFIPYL